MKIVPKPDSAPRAEPLAATAPTPLSIVVPIPAPAAVPAAAAEPDPAVRKGIQAIQEQIAALREQLDLLGSAKLREDEQLRKNAQSIQQLTEDVAGLKATLAEIQRTTAETAVRAIEALKAPVPEPVKEPVVEPVKNTLPPLPAPPVEEPIAPKPLMESKEWMRSLTGELPSEHPKERNVAFLSRLWDYLNHVEIEIPLRKKD